MKDKQLKLYIVVDRNLPATCYLAFISKKEALKWKRNDRNKKIIKLMVSI